MKSLKSLLVTLFFLFFFSVVGFSQCKKISAETKITHTDSGIDNGSIELEVHGISNKELSINLFGPKRTNRLGLSDLVIKDLAKGRYLVVVSSREEGNNICPVSINVTIN